MIIIASKHIKQIGLNYTYVDRNSFEKKKTSGRWIGVIYIPMQIKTVFWWRNEKKKLKVIYGD